MYSLIHNAPLEFERGTLVDYGLLGNLCTALNALYVDFMTIKAGR